MRGISKSTLLIVALAAAVVVMGGYILAGGTSKGDGSVQAGQAEQALDMEQNQGK